MKWKRILLKSFVFFSFFICILFTFIYFYISLSPKMDLKKTNNIISIKKEDEVEFEYKVKELLSIETEEPIITPDDIELIYFLKDGGHFL